MCLSSRFCGKLAIASFRILDLAKFKTAYQICKRSSDVVAPKSFIPSTHFRMTFGITWRDLVFVTWSDFGSETLIWRHLSVIWSYEIWFYVIWFRLWSDVTCRSYVIWFDSDLSLTGGTSKLYSEFRLNLIWVWHTEQTRVPVNCFFLVVCNVTDASGEIAAVGF